VYDWLWRRLPGSTGARLAVVAAIVLVIGLLLWYVVYPWASLHLPLDQARLGRGAAPSA
jgi:hypothetical protein